MPKSSVTVPTILHAPHISQRVAERFPDASVGGDVRWKTLISRPETRTDTFTVGVARCGPLGASSGASEEDGKGNEDGNGEGDGGGEGLKMHRHTHAEIYYVTKGKGVVTIEGEEHEVGEGSVVYTPGDAEHGMRCVGDEEVRWLYVFAADAFGEVEYRFSEKGVMAKL